MKFSVNITGWGEDALMFLSGAEDGNGFIVIFNESAPPELKELAILHTQGNLTEDPVLGDTVRICGKSYRITAIGNEALHTLRTLGHCTFSFKGGTEPDNPGYIMLEGSEPLSEADVVVGAAIEIF